MSIDKKLLVLTLKPSMNEEMVDWLISQPFKAGFTSFIVNGHSSQVTNLSIAEQVSGMQKKTRFQVVIPDSELLVFLEKLKQEFKSSGIHYWIQPIIEEGRI